MVLSMRCWILHCCVFLPGWRCWRRAVRKTGRTDWSGSRNTARSPAACTSRRWSSPWRRYCVLRTNTTRCGLTPAAIRTLALPCPQEAQFLTKLLKLTMKSGLEVKDWSQHCRLPQQASASVSKCGHSYILSEVCVRMWSKSFKWDSTQFISHISNVDLNFLCRGLRPTSQN